MAANPLTSSERRGIIAVAVAALLITGGGMLLSRCSGSRETSVTPAEIKVLLDGDSAASAPGADRSDSVARGKGKREKTSKDSLSSGNGKVKTYRRRSFLDEPV